ncbi:MAG: AMP-binding protein [Bdellovibrionota bacterium]|nr:AMP-binding protein [Bdellovibrionota bacterium]
MDNDLNISKKFVDYARLNPLKPAFVSPTEYDDKQVQKEEIITFEDFALKVASYRKGLTNQGYKKGDKIIILTPITIDFYALMMAMFTLGLVAVFLDPGIGLRKILTAIKDSKSQGIVSLKKVLKFWPLIPTLWKMRRYCSDEKAFGTKKLSSLFVPNKDPIEVTPLSPKDHVLITFTSGSTGRSKGADRNAQNVFNQLQVIEKYLACEDDIIDMPVFLMFGFMNLLYGITTVLPAAKFEKIGDINPAVIVDQMKRWNVSRMSGSYTFNDKLSQYLLGTNDQIKSLRTLILGGTPVTKEFCQRLEKIYPNSKNLMTYGSTEVAPISMCEVSELIDFNGQGSFVGLPCSELEIEIVNLPSLNFQGDLTPHRSDSWGEVLISGPHVVSSYYKNEIADRQNKVKDSQGRIWHRTGDTGQFDKEGNLILTGRLSDLIIQNENIIHPYLVENSINEIPGVERSALIRKNDQIYLCYTSQSPVEKSFFQEILEVFKIGNANILNIDSIPLDDRHNSKINRIALRKLI